MPADDDRPSASDPDAPGEASHGDTAHGDTAHGDTARGDTSGAEEDGRREAYEAAMEDPSFDPRYTITPDVFEVHEDLLGIPLAAPWRRLVAVVIDFIIAGLLANVGGAWIGLAVAFIFFRVATRRQVKNPLKRWARSTLAFLGALVLFITAVALVDTGEDESEPSPLSVASMMTREDAPPESATAPSPESKAVADTVAQLLQRYDVNPQRLDRLPGLSPLTLEAISAAESPLDSMAPAARADMVQTLRRFADAVAARDTAAVDSLQPAAAAITAGPRLESLRSRINETETRSHQLEDENQRLEALVEEPSFFYIARATANDLGLTFGWIAVYFTLFWAWWDGQTPGKRLVDCKVVRLDGEPISLWFALERFGGYAAGVITGFLGFAQLYWDPNRQGIHDRIARTVVIRTSQDSRS